MQCHYFAGWSGFPSWLYGMYMWAGWYFLILHRAIPKGLLTCEVHQACLLFAIRSMHDGVIMASEPTGKGVCWYARWCHYGERSQWEGCLLACMPVTLRQAKPLREGVCCRRRSASWRHDTPATWCADLHSSRKPCQVPACMSGALHPLRRLHACARFIWRWWAALVFLLAEDLSRNIDTKIMPGNIYRSTWPREYRPPRALLNLLLCWCWTWARGASFGHEQWNRVPLPHFNESWVRPILKGCAQK